MAVERELELREFPASHHTKHCDGCPYANIAILDVYTLGMSVKRGAMGIIADAFPDLRRLDLPMKDDTVRSLSTLAKSCPSLAYLGVFSLNRSELLSPLGKHPLASLNVRHTDVSENPETAARDLYRLFPDLRSVKSGTGNVDDPGNSLRGWDDVLTILEVWREEGKDMASEPEVEWDGEDSEDSEDIGGDLHAARREWDLHADDSFSESGDYELEETWEYNYC